MQMQLAAPTTDEDIRDRARAFPRERSHIYVTCVPNGFTEKLAPAHTISLINLSLKINCDTRLFTIIRGNHGYCRNKLRHYERDATSERDRPE